MAAHSSIALNAAVEDFRRVRRQAVMQELVAWFTGRSAKLLPFEEVRHKLKIGVMMPQRRQEIPLAAIVGSVGRYNDFTRSFLPRQESDESRWAGVKAAMLGPQGVPPIEVYQIGQVYFVLDGNHRVSVAHHLGMTQIEAYVSEFQTNIPLAPDDRPDNLIVKVEYADFLEQTGLHKIRPEADLRVTVPGQYWELMTQLEAHRFLLSQEQAGQTAEVSAEESLGHWYDHAYWPVIQNIRARDILRDFPNRTETDLYLWIFRHHHLLEKKLGWSIELDTATTDWAAEQSHKSQPIVARTGKKLRQALTPSQLEAGPVTGAWRLERLNQRQSERLFIDLLVPLSGDEGGWQALELALAVAHQEQGRLIGLHIVPSEAQKESQAVQAIQMEFQQRCQAAGLPGKLTIAVGDVIDNICERARWADLIVMYPADPPGTGLMSRFSSGSRNVIQRSCRPVLTVPGPASALKRVLLAYDGSTKAQEGLFVAAYLAGRWQVSLLVLTVIEQESQAGKLDQAQQYLTGRGVSATFKSVEGDAAEAILQTAAEQPSDLIIMGGYGAKPLREVVLGSTIDQVLRESDWPILVCR